MAALPATEVGLGLSLTALPVPLAGVIRVEAGFGEFVFKFLLDAVPVLPLAAKVPCLAYVAVLALVTGLVAGFVVGGLVVVGSTFFSSVPFFISAGFSGNLAVWSVLDAIVLVDGFFYRAGFFDVLFGFIKCCYPLL